MEELDKIHKNKKKEIEVRYRAQEVLKFFWASIKNNEKKVIIGRAVEPFVYAFQRNNDNFILNSLQILRRKVYDVMFFCNDVCFCVKAAGYGAIAQTVETYIDNLGHIPLPKLSVLIAKKKMKKSVHGETSANILSVVGKAAEVGPKVASQNLKKQKATSPAWLPYAKKKKKNSIEAAEVGPKVASQNLKKQKATSPAWLPYAKKKKKNSIEDEEFKPEVDRKNVKNREATLPVWLQYAKKKKKNSVEQTSDIYSSGEHDIGDDQPTDYSEEFILSDTPNLIQCSEASNITSSNEQQIRDWHPTDYLMIEWPDIVKEKTDIESSQYIWITPPSEEEGSSEKSVLSESFLKTVNKNCSGRLTLSLEDVASYFPSSDFSTIHQFPCNCAINCTGKLHTSFKKDCRTWLYKSKPF